MLVTRAKTTGGNAHKQDTTTITELDIFPSHQQLSQMFEHIRRQAFGKDVGLLELRVDLLNVNSISSMLHIVFAITSDVLAKPVYLAVVELRARRTVSGFEVGESQSTIVVFSNRCGEFGDNILRDTETFGDRLGELP